MPVEIVVGTANSEKRPPEKGAPLVLNYVLKKIIRREIRFA